MKNIRVFATVDIKENEAGIIGTAEYFGKELKIISRDDIQKIENNFETSQFVKKSIGVGAVSAPCAFIAGKGRGKFLAEKLKYEGITISNFEEEKKKNEQKR